MKKSHLLGAVCACFFVQSAHAVPIVFGTNAYEVITGSISWTSAKTAAEALTFNGQAGHLVTITTAAEQTFVQNNLLGSTQLWLGGSDAAVEGQWEWVNGEGTFWLGDETGSVQGGLFENWIPGQPDAFSSSEDYLILTLAGGGQWNDGPSPNPNPKGYIVEYDNAVPIPAAFWLFGSGLLGLAGMARRKKT